MNKTRVFVSSTCYDLSQIRKDLQDGIRAMGHEPILSENKDFPVNPSLSSVENCVEAVKNDADIFVLIIGNKYGCQMESGRSITNTEFLTAIEKGIPVYSFTLQNMVAILPVWKMNPDGDYSGVVDNNKVFEFIDDVRTNKALWNFEFRTAQDILEILKSQLSFLLKSSLENTKVLNKVDGTLLRKLSGKAIKLLVNKEAGYEAKFFFQVLMDEIESYQELKRDYLHSVFFKTSGNLPDTRSVLDWVDGKFDHLHQMLESLDSLFLAWNQYIGEPGSPSDIAGLYYVAHRIGEFYANLLEWMLDTKRTFVPDLFMNLKNSLAELPVEFIKELENYGIESVGIIDEFIEKKNRGEIREGECLNLTLHPSIPDELQERFKHEVDVLQSHIVGKRN